MKHHNKNTFRIALMCFTILLLGFICASTANAQNENYSFVIKWGSLTGTDGGKFKYIASVAVDSSENIYVTDSSNNRIQKFDSNGIFLAKWGSGGTGDGQFDYPEGIAVNSSGNIYVADTSNNRIQKFALINFIILENTNPSLVLANQPFMATVILSDLSAPGDFVVRILHGSSINEKWEYVPPYESGQTVSWIIKDLISQNPSTDQIDIKDFIPGKAITEKLFPINQVVA
jgi:DNA-binding beta-propeller fold protein YncE